VGIAVLYLLSEISGNQSEVKKCRLYFWTYEPFVIGVDGNVSISGKLFHPQNIQLKTKSLSNYPGKFPGRTSRLHICKTGWEDSTGGLSARPLLKHFIPESCC
jgi:hypothetical protein